MTYPNSAELKRNFEYFQSVVQKWVSTDAGRFALIRSQQLVGFYDTPGDAAQAGAKRFDDGQFSVQRVTDRPVDLGFLSYGSGDRATG